jgi:hypothetical protein
MSEEIGEQVHIVGDDLSSIPLLVPCFLSF